MHPIFRISTFPYILLVRNGYQSDEVVRLQKRGYLRVCASDPVRGWDGKISPSSSMCVCVCMLEQELPGKLLANVSCLALCLLSFSFPVYVSLCKCLWNISCVKKKQQQKRFQSPRLERINSSVSLGNCFKESVYADAIIHEGWRNHLCNIELSFESLSEGLK